MTSFGDIIKFRRLKYVIKMTSQKFSIFKLPSLRSLAKSRLRPCRCRGFQNKLGLYQCHSILLKLVKKTNILSHIRKYVSIEINQNYLADILKIQVIHY